MYYGRHLAILAVLLLWINDALGLDCYQCSSAVDPDCKEDFDWEHFNMLTIKPTKCEVDQARYCIKTTGVWGGIVGTQRFCSSRDMFNQCQYVDFENHNRRYRACIYTCSTDGCNAALPSVALPSKSALLLLSTVLVFINYILHSV